VALVLVTLFRLVAYSRDPILLACVLVVGAVALATAVALWAIAGTAQPPTWLVRVAYVAVGLTALGNIAVFLVLTGGTFAGPLVVTLALQLFMAGYIIRCIREATAAE
jgi:hypothetical protein